jgi:hypothetical protein
VLVGAAVVGFRMLRDSTSLFEGGEECTARVSGRTVTLTPEQAENAAVIAAIAVRRGLPARAVSIALATAYQESKLRNLDHGDRDSLGLFQQRPSQGWGRPKHLLAPNYAAAAFYLPLSRLPHWWRMPLTKAAQAVQASAFPNAYARWELLAATLVDRQLHVPDAQLNCSR